jgi:integrase
MGYLSKDWSDFIESRTADGYSKSTVKNYRRTAKVTLMVLGDMKTESLTHRDMDRLFANRPGSQTPQTMNEMQSHFMAFFKWCRERNVTSPNHNPLAGRRFRRIAPVARKRVPVAEFPALLDAAPNARDRIIIALGLYLMLRQSEIADLRVGDVDLQSGQITCRIFKTKDLDVMPISKELDRELRAWFKVYQDNAGPLHYEWYLAPSRRFGRDDYGPNGIMANRLGVLTPTVKSNAIERIVKHALTGIGWEMYSPAGKPEWHGAHVLRRSAARAMFDELAKEGYDGALRTVQAWLHHKNSTMTEHYLGIEIDRATRNKKYTGEAMFPSLEDAHVIRLEVIRGEGDNAAM